MIPSHLTGKGKGDNLIRGKYRGLKLLDHALKGIERVMEKIIWERAFISAWNLTSCLVWTLLMQHSSSDNCQKNIWLITGNCSRICWPSKGIRSSKKKSYLVPCENLALRNELCSLYRQRTTTPEVKLEWITPTVMNLESKLEFIRVQCLALSYLSLRSKLCLVKSTMGHPRSCCMLMT